jgi:hypothetical protein
MRGFESDGVNLMAVILARTFHKYARALAGALFSRGIFLSRRDPLVRRSLGKFPEKTKSCAIIAAIHEMSGLDDSNDRQSVFVYFVARMLSTIARVRQIHG